MKIPYFMDKYFDQFTKKLPYEVWLMIHEIIEDEFRKKLKKLEFPKYKLVVSSDTICSDNFFMNSSINCFLDENSSLHHIKIQALRGFVPLLDLRGQPGQEWL